MTPARPSARPPALVDWDYNGYLDLIIIADDADAAGEKFFEVHFLLQNPADSVSASKCTLLGCQLVNDFSISLDSFAQPFIIPLEQQEFHMHGLMFFSKSKGSRNVLFYDVSASGQSAADRHKLIDFSQLVDITSEQCSHKSPLTYFNRQLADIHFSSVVDLNGDCRSDLFIHSKVPAVDANGDTVDADVFEIYVRQENGMLCLVEVY